MSQLTKETTTIQTAQDDASVIQLNPNEATPSQSIEYAVYFIFSIIEIILVFRLILKIMGASSVSGFVQTIYGISGMLALPFEGIFRRISTTGMETTATFEPSTIVAIAVYAIMAWVIVRLIRIGSGEKQVS